MSRMEVEQSAALLSKAMLEVITPSDAHGIVSSFAVLDPPDLFSILLLWSAWQLPNDGVPFWTILHRREWGFFAISHERPTASP